MTYYLKPPTLVNIPLSSIRHYILGVSDQFSPFVYALSKAINSEDKQTVLLHILRDFFHQYTPKTIYELLDIPFKLAPGLSTAPHWIAPHPWDSSTIKQRVDAMLAGIKSENRVYRALSNASGVQWCGPVDNTKLLIETNRYLSIYNRIKHEGYLRHDDIDGDIEVHVLIDNEDSQSYLIMSGGHRYAALCALGVRSIPVRLTAKILRADVENWPNVQNGMYSITGALQLFDRYMTGFPPTSMLNWIKINDPVHHYNEVLSSISTNIIVRNSNINKSKRLKLMNNKIARKLIKLFNNLHIILRKRHKLKKTISIKLLHICYNLGIKKFPIPKPVGDCYYGDAANLYEEQRFSTDLWKREEKCFRNILNQLPSGLKALDVPFGTGRFTPIYHQHNISVTGLDASVDMLEIAKHHRPSDIERVSLIKGLAEQLPFKDNEFDLVTSFRFLFRTIPADQAEATIKEISRVTNQYAILEFCVKRGSKDDQVIGSEILWNRLTLNSIKKLLLKHGLNTINTFKIANNFDCPGITAFVCKKTNFTC